MDKDLKNEMDELLRRLFPLARSITGEGLRETLKILQEYIPLVTHEVRSGTRAFDWTVPQEWIVREAYIKGPDGNKVVNFKQHNLHVMSYSIPVRAKMSLQELRPHLHSLPEQPELIPYRTSYYHPAWGFCLPDKVLRALPEGEYEVLVDSELKDGALTYGEYYLPGETKEEILLSAYVCHPSMANDNLSGVVLAAFLGKALQKFPHPRYSYRFLFVPETIGALVWLSRNEKIVPRIKHGLVITCVGDSGAFTYKKSRRGDAVIDRAAEKMLADSGAPFELLDFAPTGSDERQFCSPGFNLPVGSLMRTQYGRFRQYHTSGDNLDLVRGEYLAKSLEKYLALLEILENDRIYQNTNSKGEPMLSKYGLYNQQGGSGRSERELARLWVLNLSDGRHSLLDIALRAQIKFSEIAAAARELTEIKLLKLISK